MPIKTPFISHTEPIKIIDEHLNGVMEKIRKYVPERLRVIADIIASCHDFGKYSPFFQDKIQNGIRSVFANHSHISAIATYAECKKKGFEKKQSILAYWAVYAHHSDLSDLEIIISEKQQYLKYILDNMFKGENNELVKKEISRNNYCREVFEYLQDNFLDIVDEINEVICNSDFHDDSYITLLQLYSALIEADKEDAASYDSEIEINELSSEDIDNFVFNKPVCYSLDHIRSNIYNTISDSFKKAPETHFYSITLPTGGGKTITGLKIAQLIKEKYNLERIIYSLPWTSVIDQNYEVYKEIFSYNGKFEMYSVNKDHHLAGIPETSGEDEKVDEILFRMESWESYLTCTTFNRLFDAMIGYKNMEVKRLVNLYNSVVVLDEPQALPPKYIKLFREIFKKYAQNYNCYFLIMTATKPNILECSHELSDDKYFKYLEFQRTEMYINHSIETIDEFLARLRPEGNTLIVCNTISTCKEIYNRLKVKMKNVYCLNTEMVPAYRRKVLNEVKEKMKKEQTVLVSTQLIEAGIDISFEKVYRDFAPLDSLIQAAGRCNRNKEKNVGVIEVVNIENECRKVYDIVNLDLTEEILKGYERISESRYPDIVKAYFNLLEKRISVEGENIIKAIRELNFDGKKGIKSFELIKNEPKISIFVNDDKSKSIWKEFIEYRNRQEGYKNRRVSWYKIKARFFEYTTNIWPQNAQRFLRNSMDDDICKKYGIIQVEVPNTIYDPYVGFVEKM